MSCGWWPENRSSDVALGAMRRTFNTRSVGNPETEIGLAANFRVARHPPGTQVPIDFATSFGSGKCLFLLTYFVGFAEPSEDFRVKIFLARNWELIDVIVRRKKFDADKARTLDPVLKPETSDETILRDTGNSCKAHARLKADPGFVDIHFHWSTFPHQLQKCTVEFLVNGNRELSYRRSHRP